uniref:MaoC-like domain-containing protein n=1 Tax=Strigamia maritima TaxID=126957 RepID=T1JMG7_STRMM
MQILIKVSLHAWSKKRKKFYIERIFVLRLVSIIDTRLHSITMALCRPRVLARSLFVFPNLRFFTIAVNDFAEIVKTFTYQDVANFARISGDSNPIHLDPEFARRTKYGRCIVHGALLNGLISAVLGTKLPGPGCVVVNQNLEYTSPLFIGETVVARINITDVKKTIVEANYTCSVLERSAIVLKGNAKLVITKF